MTRGRRILTAIAAVVGLLAAAALLAIVAFAVFGVTIDASRWRDAAAARASAALRRPVVFEGPFELTLGRETVLRVGGVRILNPPGFSTPDFAVLGDARARFDLLDALRGRLHVLSVEAADGRLKLERAADGRVNWTGPPRQTEVPAARSHAVLPDVAIDRIALRNLALEHFDARSTKRRIIELDELAGSGSWDTPLRLELRGRIEHQFPYTIALEGGPARLLQSGSEPWPFNLDFEFLATRLHASGAVDAEQGEARFDFGAGTEDLAQVERFLDTKLPRFGVAALYGTVVVAAKTIELVDLRGLLGASEIVGGLTLALGEGRPRVSGALTVTTFDLRPFLVADSSPRDEPLGYDELARQSLPLRDLVPVDVDIDLRVGRWLGLPGDVRDAHLDLHANADSIRAPLGVTFAGVPFSGRLDLDTAAPTPTFAVALDAKDSALGDLARVLTGATGIEGTLGRFGLRLGGRGDTLGALVRDLELALTAAAARLSYGNFAGGRAVAFTLDTLDVTVRRGERLRGSARGTLLGERASLSIRGGTLPNMLRELATPIELELAAANAKMRIAGTLAPPEATSGTDLTFGLEARRVGDLARWLGIAPESKLSLRLRGRVRVVSDAWHLDETTLKLGRSELTVDAHRTGFDGRPITVAAVRSPLIDVPELATLRASLHAGTRGRPDARIDVPLLPYRIDIEDADIGLGLKRVDLGRIDLIDVGFAARVREGRVPPSPVAATLGGALFQGLVALDLRGEVPEATLELAAGAIDVGALLRQLGVAEDIDGRADALQVELLARGSTLRELAARSAFEARVMGGSVTVRGAAERPLAEIRVNQAIVGAPAGSRIQVRLDGTLDAIPVEIEVASGTLADFARDATRVPFSVAANAAGARLTLEGEAALPLGRGGQLTLEMSGERLDTLSGLARVELPPWGPWSMRGPIRMTPTGYEVERLVMRVGESQLNGTGRLDVTGPRPRLDVRVTAPSIQLDDFPPPERLTEAPEPVTAERLRATVRDAAGQTQRLLSAGFLRRLDGYLDVEVRQVLSGTDRLAYGAFRAQVVEGRLYLGPLQVDMPTGTLRLSISYDPTASNIKLAVGAHVERVDYGIFARRLRRADDVQGLFSLNLELSGRAPSLDEIMRHADGRIDFAVWPTGLRAGIFDLWSVNMVLALLPVIDPGGRSRVNCVVGRFDLNDGMLDDDRIMIDTTGVRVRGAGRANFETEELAFVFRPRAKGFALFRLQTPLRVAGTFTDFSVGVDPSDVLPSILRLVASPIIAPFEWLTQGPLPRNGADVCTDPLRQ